MENNLRSTFKQKYDRKKWQSVLIGIMGDDKVNYSLTPKSIALTDTQLLKIEKVLNIGTIQTSDKKELPVFEIHLKPTVIIERNRVTVNEIIKQYLIKDARDGAIAVFYYPDYQKTEWRFSFISPGSENSFFEELEIESTNSKRYSYVFGVAEEEHRTAARQFIQLSESKKTLNDFFEAFNVEKMSKEFFDEYKEQYLDFIQFITGTRIVNQKEQVVHSPHNYFITIFGSDKKRVRDFMKKLLGRIIFLYFIQKKGWLGASSISYKDGDKNFLKNFFDQSANEAFYPNWLSKLFFDTLNKKRDNDDFKMPDGSIVKIPFLNGGLFDKVNTKYDWLTFSPSLFQYLFNFLNRYNFTIYEDSPDDHTVAVDPEMLGHIFENLLEDNKDKGAFYTPKEIVQYMTQESLIEYLHTHLPTLDKKYLILLVKYKTLDNIFELKDNIDDIDHLLDKVKICDPAIGSGAFPMGLLQEIFAIKDVLNHEKGSGFVNQAKVKEHIIQNSIYGVDVEQGAVDIARLRFWLSLVVYEDIPKPLPNLDFKIVVGDSLLSKFEDQILHIDWEVKSAKTGKMIAADIRKELSQLSQKQKEYFESADKTILNQEIRELKLGIIEKQIRFNQLQYNEYNSVQGNIFEGKLKRSAKQNTEVQSFGLLLNKIATLRANPDKELQFFDWKLNFPEVLNPIIAGDNPGFDIVIGNPPYIKEYTNLSAFDGFRNTDYYQGKMDIWYGFSCFGLDYTKKGGLESFIAQNNWITSSGASILRNKVLKESKIQTFTDFGNYKVFESAGIQTMIFILKKEIPPKNYTVKYSRLLKDKINKEELNAFLDFNQISESIFKHIDIKFSPLSYENDSISFTESDITFILDRISAEPVTFLKESEIAQGIVPNVDVVNSRNIERIPKPKRELHDINIGDSVFVVNKDYFNYLSKDELKYVKPLIEPYETGRYLGVKNYKKEIIYISKKDYKNDAPNLEKHLEKFSEIMLERRENKSGQLKYYHLHWPRDKKFFEKGSKILSIRKCSKPSFTYTVDEIFVMMAFNVIKTNRLNIKFLTALFNSKLVSFWLKYKGKLQGNAFQIDKEPLMAIPIKEPINAKPFEAFVEYLLFINDLGEFEQLNEFVPNSHIIQLFEEVIDAMVFELYFPDDFKKADIHFIEYVERDFIPIEGKTPVEQKEILHNAYQKLREKDNEIRNNLKEMKLELRDLLMPILTI
ncbi:MAG TPA: N-6 DNA methylase [Paludibacter sp.]